MRTEGGRLDSIRWLWVFYVLLSFNFDVVPSVHVFLFPPIEAKLIDNFLLLGKM
jgi:hypothetical protein